MHAHAGDARPGDLLRIRDQRWRVTRRVAYDDNALIETDGCDDVNRGTRACFLVPFEPVDRIAVSTRPRAVRPTRWRRIARRALGDATPGWTALRAATRARLNVVPFQLEPTLALIRGDGCRFLIADAVGLGKTVQAGLMIAEVLQRQAGARAIVVCPSGLREQWHDELRTRFELDAESLDAAGVARSAARLPGGFNPWAAHPLVITSIDYVKRPEVMRSLETLVWDLVVFDEAHGLAGRSDRAAAAAALAGRARVVVMLTATPHSGDADAFARMCRIGQLGGDDRLLLFSRTRADAGISGSRRSSLLRVRPTVAEAAMHAALHRYTQRVWRYTTAAATAGARLAMSVLARRACSSAASLALSVDRRLALLGREEEAPRQPGLPFGPGPGDDSAPDSLLAIPGLPDAADERRRLAHLLRLAHAAARVESKLQALRRLLSRTREPAIVFTEYRDTLEHVASSLGGVTFVRLHGGLTQRERADALRQFTSGAVRLLLATDAASEGLNLQHQCRLVVNLELPWTPLRLEQRAGRVDRIGQAKRVHIVHLVAAGTSEDAVLSQLAARVGRIRAAIGPGACPVLPGELRIAEAVIGGTPLAEVSAPILAPEMVCPTLVDEGRAEADRIRLARCLLRRAAEELPAPRPVVTVVTRRRSRGAAPIWVFRLLFVDERGRGISEELLALTAIRGTAAGLFAGSYLRVHDVAALAGDQRRVALAGELDAPIRLWLQREQWVSAALRDTYARLSAPLLQLGLFDRRNQRTAAAQTALLDEALASSAARRQELIDRQGLRIESNELAFAVAFK